jgi:SAM-dependent methyltransferase
MAQRAIDFNEDRAGVTSSAMDGASNYFGWQRDLLASHIGSRVLEVGCGIGGFTRTLLGRECVVSVDIDPEMIERLARSLDGQAGWHGLVADLMDPDFAERVAPYRCDSVTALNVIEHIEDDVGALGTLRSLLPEGGRAALLVPAHQALYGTFDIAVGHYRRYTTSELAAKVVRAGFRADRTFYFNMIGAVGWWVNYRLLRMRRVNRGTSLQVGLFDRWIVPAARHFERRFRAPFGISAICLATAR